MVDPVEVHGPTQAEQTRTFESWPDPLSGKTLKQGGACSSEIDVLIMPNEILSGGVVRSPLRQI